MATVTQSITLAVTVTGLNVGAAGGMVMFERSPTTQRVPAYREIAMIDAVNMQYVWNGVAVWPVTPSVLTGPGADAMAQVIADFTAATAAGVYNL